MAFAVPQARAAPSERPVLQRSSDQLYSVGHPLDVILAIPLIQGEARSLVMATDAHDITDERKRCPFRWISVDERASVEAVQLEVHARPYLQRPGRWPPLAAAKPVLGGRCET